MNIKKIILFFSPIIFAYSAYNEISGPKEIIAGLLWIGSFIGIYRLTIWTFSLPPEAYAFLAKTKNIGWMLYYNVITYIQVLIFLKWYTLAGLFTFVSIWGLVFRMIGYIRLKKIETVISERKFQPDGI